MLAIIGGSGLCELSNLTVSRREMVRTPYGEPSSSLTLGTVAGREVAFLARHGDAHVIPPHEVNYRANIWALHALGAKNVIAVAAAGGIGRAFKPGVLMVPDQIIDYTHGRAATFFTLAELGLRHIDFTQPYCQTLRTACLAAGRQAGVAMIDGGVYAATQGPRLETAAEINRLERDGANVVGMTGMPEAGLARELGLCYAAIVVVANHAAGRGASGDGIAISEIATVLEKAMGKVRATLEKLVIDGD